ncbi:MAG: hypothetical protein A3G41_04730 [Elusimicrobia bacterium RIFCSPLOWO2_12_FULL_59_9]|nr:MAG: hypothetical protein A3G41_04730 [Elusimicrobia bacterium RIFCSPLOWO2_12_FULL_59_9]
MKATRDAFGEAIAALGEKNPRIVVLDADLGKSTMTGAFMKRFPERHFELGIAESNMIGAAAGLALCGKIPFVTSFACFLIGRLETIRVAVAYNQTNVKMVGTHAGLGIGEDGPSQMGLEDLGALRSLPHVTLLQPGDAEETRQIVAWAAEHKGPVYIRLTRQKVPDVHSGGYQWKLGRLDPVFTPAGETEHFQASVLAGGGTLEGAIDAAKALEKKGFSVRVFNAPTIKPLDSTDVLDAARNSNRLVSVEDHSVVGGLGSAVAEVLAGAGLPAPLIRLGATRFGESGTGAELYSKYGLSSEHIQDACIRNIPQ